MNIMFAWVLGVAVLVILLAVFLLLRRRETGDTTRVNAAPAREEFAEEITYFPASPPHAKPKPKLDIPEISWRYGTDRLVLMVRDPNWLFAYWEITATKQEEFNQQYGPAAWSSSRPVLRVYDITGIHFTGDNANNYTDITVSDHVDSWHIEVGRPNSTFCVDLGRIFPDGRFVTLLRSNIVQTPSIDISSLVDEEWMWIEDIYRTISRYHIGSSPMVTEQVAREMGLIPLGISSPGFAK